MPKQQLFYWFCGVLCCLVVHTTATAQKIFTCQELLNDTTTQKEWLAAKQGLAFLTEVNQEMPLLEKLELRTETDEWDFERQEYLLRTSFTSPKMRDLQELKVQTQLQKFNLINQAYQGLQLYDKYEYLVQWYYIEVALDLLNKKKALLEDRKTVFQRMIANTLTFDIGDLLKVEESLQALNQQKVQLEHQEEFIILQLTNQQIKAEATNLSKEDWLNLERMQERIAQLENSPAMHVKYELQQLEINTKVLEQEEEKIESEKILDFVQVKYSGRDNLTLGKELSIGLGINIPMPSQGRVKRNEARLEMFEEQLQLEELEAETEKERRENYTEFEALVKEHQLIQQYVEEAALAGTYEKYQQVGEIPPLTLLRIKESILKNEISTHEIEKKACLLYIKILRDKGVLMASPAVNYLSIN